MGTVLFSQSSLIVDITQFLSDAKKRALCHTWEWGPHFGPHWAIPEGWLPSQLSDRTEH